MSGKHSGSSGWVHDVIQVRGHDKNALNLLAQQHALKTHYSVAQNPLIAQALLAGRLRLGIQWWELCADLPGDVSSIDSVLLPLAHYARPIRTARGAAQHTSCACADALQQQAQHSGTHRCVLVGGVCM